MVMPIPEGWPSISSRRESEEKVLLKMPLSMVKAPALIPGRDLLVVGEIGMADEVVAAVIEVIIVKRT